LRTYVGDRASENSDAAGKRVRKTVGGANTDYLYDLGGHAVTEVTSGAMSRGEVYAGDRHLATYFNSTTYFNHVDWLGTERARSTVAGASSETCTSLAFGDGLTCAGADVCTRHFTGKERDSESGSENFLARYYGSALGRFLGPDEPSADQQADDPQSWDLYSYVRNNPPGRLDPDGRACVAVGGGFGDDHSGGQSCAEANDPKNNDKPSATVNGDAPAGADDARVIQFAFAIIKRNLLSNTLKIYGIGAAVGATGGAACYYLCPAATTTTLGLAGTAGVTAAPILYRTGDVFEQVVESPAGPVKIVGEVVVEGTKITIKNISIFSAETGQRINVGTGNMLRAVRSVLDGLKQAGYTEVRITGWRVSGANPGRIIDITKSLR
jgi:RHS repeat-associated protein